MLSGRFFLQRIEEEDDFCAVGSPVQDGDAAKNRIWTQFDVLIELLLWLFSLLPEGPSEVTDAHRDYMHSKVCEEAAESTKTRLILAVLDRLKQVGNIDHVVDPADPNGYTNMQALLRTQLNRGWGDLVVRSLNEVVNRVLMNDDFH